MTSRYQPRLTGQDARRIAAQGATIQVNAGHEIKWFRKQSTGTGGAPELGIEHSIVWTETTIQANIRPGTIDDTLRSGGTVAEGSLLCQTTVRLGVEDHVLFDGRTYEVASVPMSIYLGNKQWYQCMIEISS